MKKSERTLKYEKFMKSAEWKQIKERLFKARGMECEECGSYHNLQVHHLNYKRFGGKEKNSDLKVLCRKHHAEIHGLLDKTPKPVKNINYYRTIAIRRFKLKNKGMRGWIGLAKVVYLCIEGDFRKFKSGPIAKRYVIKALT